MLAYFHALSVVLSKFVKAITKVIETFNTLRRVQLFLELTEIDPKRAAGVVSKRISDMVIWHDKDYFY